MVIICDLYDKDKNLLRANFAYTGRKMFRDAGGTWARAELVFDIPGNVNGVPVEYMQVYMDAYQLDDGVPAYIDDVYVYQGLNTHDLESKIASMDSFLDNRGVSNYRANSVEALKSAVANAKRLISENIATATQEEVDLAFAQIKKAYDELELLPLITEVKAFLSDLSYDANKSWAEAEGMRDGIYNKKNIADREFSVKIDGEVNTYPNSVGTKAPSKLYYDLSGKDFDRFEALIGLDLNAPAQEGIDFNMELGPGKTFSQVDVTEGVKAYGEDQVVSFMLSGNVVSTAGNYFGSKDKASEGLAPTLIIELKDGTTQTVVVSDNSQVQGGTYEDTNFSDSSSLKAQLVVSKHGNPILMRNAFLRFNLNGISIDDIEAAELKLYSYQYGTSTIQVTALSYDYWNPTTITWNNQPRVYQDSEIDADKGPIFRIYGDGKLFYDSGAVGNRHQDAKKISIPIIDVDELCLEVDANGSILADNAVWADAKFLTFTLQDQDAVVEDKVALTWDIIKGQDTDANHVTKALNLPDTGIYGSDIRWSASPSGYIDTETGSVTRPVGFNQIVKLTATISKGTLSEVKEFVVTVLAEPSVFLSSVSLGNELVQDFTPEKEEYTVVLPYGTIDVPIASANVMDPQATVEIQDAETVDGVTKIIVTSPELNLSKTYRFKLEVTTETDAFAAIRSYIEANELSGDLGHSMAVKLVNKLNQAEKMRDMDKTKQAIKHMEDFIKHLHNKGQQDRITDEIKTTLEADAEVLIAVWNRESK